MKLIIEQILEYGASQPQKAAVVDGKSILTYGELIREINSVKKVLLDDFHLEKGDSIILAADKQPQFVSLYLACHAAGLVTLPIATDTNQNRYRMIKEKVSPSLVIGFEDDSGDVSVMKLKDFMEKTNRNEANTAGDTSLLAGPDDVADIMFTTGTTGEPKGVPLTHRNIAAAARNINTFIGNTKEDVEMIALPISHSFGIGRMRCALSNGQTIVMLGSFANAGRFFRFMEQYKVTGFGMVPASFALLKKLSGMKIAAFAEQLRYIEIGSAPMPTEEKIQLMESLPHTRICMHYGLTEASRSAFMEFHDCREHLTTVGKQSPGMHITIRDENGNEVGPGAEGEICVDGDAVMRGYLGIPKAASFWGESFRTGDWGTVDEEGFITLKSRKKELINVGGRKVSPSEIEEVLMSFGFVKDCACVAVPDPDGILGDVPKAFIVTDEPKRVTYEIMDTLIGNRLEGYKHPLQYEVTDVIPKTSSGKVQRLMLNRNDP